MQGVGFTYAFACPPTPRANASTGLVKKDEITVTVGAESKIITAVFSQMVS